MAHRSSGAKDLVITCIKGDGRFLKFWALPINALDTIKNLESHFSKLKNELDSLGGFARSEQIPVGFKCAVKSLIKGRVWCRARVLAMQGYSIVVQLMDYGNEEVVSIQDVRSVDDQILSIPPQAVECILADVTPARGAEWSAEAIHFCEQHLLYNTLSCYVVSEYMKLPVVRVAKKGENEPFVQRLINGGLALIKPETPSQPVASLTYKMNGMDQNTSHLVKVSCVENAHKFYVQLSAAEMELKHLMDAINRLPRESLTALKVPAVNTPCLAQLSSKPCFYRALITVIQQTRCKVFFVDYGFSELKDIQELRSIPQTFMNLPTQAICCSLPREATIEPDEFKRLINFEHLECYVLSRTADSYIVKLLCRGQDLLLASQTYIQQKLNPGAKCEVTVSYVNDLKEFYCQLTHFKDQQNAISSILNSGYNFLPISFSECTPGKPVCVKFSEDNMWYRAQIVKINHENDIEVFFVDFGNYDNVNLSDMRKIGHDALKFPIQAYKCYLYETLLPSDSKAKDDAFDMFEELTADQCLLAHVHLLSEDSGYAVTLYSKNSNVPINEKLQSTFLSVPTVPVNDIEKVFVTSFDSPSSFFVQFEKLDSDNLTQMTEDINSFYSGSENSSYIPKQGSLVCARFNADEQFYRAKVEKFRDGFCEVFFIDYGNRETISVKDVHQLDPSFTKYPQFGTDCAFEKCPSELLNDKLAGLMLENSIQVKFIRKENDKWYISLDENFPDNVALLELLRQHENVTPRSIHGAGLGGYQEKLNTMQVPLVDSKKVNQFNNRHEIKKNEEPPKKEAFEDYSLISIPPKACRHVYVSHVISPSEFYCQIEEDSPKLQLLMKTIEDAYTANTDAFNFTEFVTGAPCCAIYEDGAWYRGKIKNTCANSCNVFFVDYGNVSSVSSRDIKKLRSDLFRWPAQAIRCKSFNISPKGKDWSEDEINAFINMTLDKSFVAQFVDCDNSGVYAVNLVSIGKLEEDIFNKEFVSLGFGRLQDPGKSLVLNSHAASNNLTFRPQSITVGTSEPVEVTYGLNPGEIFCQLKSNAKVFKEMMISLQDYYSKVSEAESLIDRPHQGMICVAQFFLDSAWYRAEIKKVEANKIIVLYVDYGNSETVDRKKVRCIIQDYTSLPVQAVKCRIRGISPPGKTWTVNQNLGKYFEGNAICKFISQEDDYFLVDIMCNQKNVAEWLVADGLALSDTKPKEEVPPILPERKDAFVPGQLLSVIVSYIENPTRFWCQLLDESDILDQLMAEIGSKVSEFVSINPSQLAVDSYCLAQYSEDEAWYRAQVKSFEPDGVKVFFVDYGNSEVVAKSQVKALPAEFSQQPPQCFVCCLQSTPSKLLPEMTELFRSTVEEVDELTAKVENRNPTGFVVSLLFDRDDQELNVSELLFGVSEAAHAVAEPSLSCVAPPQFLSPDVPLGLHEGYVSTVHSPQDFYIQLSSSEDALAELSAELASEDLPAVSSPDLCVGYACASKYSEDNNWYRSEVITVQDSAVEVLFVDYGNLDTVPKDSLKNLTEKHLQIRPLAIKCKLNGIVPATEEWSEEAISTFENMVLESCLGITFISKDIPATVNIAKDDKEIAQCLVDMELANFESCAETDEAYAEDHLAPPPVEDPLSSLPNDQSYPQRKLSSSKMAVKICYVDSCDKFYVTPLELGTELDTVMTTLNILYASNDNADVLEDPKVLMPCVAKYSEDEAWYRAVITEIDGENIYVTFVDYGNSEITTLKNLRPITPELVKIPPIAMECSLYGIEAVPGQEQEIMAKLEEYFVDELELEMEICEFSPYKIKLSCNGDIASMLVKEGLAKEQDVIGVECDSFVDSSKMTFVDESLEYRTQISKRFFTGVDKIVGNVKFCEIENDLVAFHVVSANLEEELQDLQQKLQDAYSEAPGNLANASCLDFCATKYMEDENWYRAQVLSFDNDKVKVRFIDYGNCETVDRSDIYELLPDFTVEPQFSVKCILFGLKVNKSKEVELQNRLDEYVYHDSVELKLCKQAHAVCDLCILSLVCNDIDISEMIVKEELVSQQYIVNTGLDVHFKATIQRIEPDVIYVLPSNLEPERQAFQNKLQEICEGLNTLSADIHAQYLYAAKIDGTWYRVSVTDTSGQDASLYVVDFGSTGVVAVSNLILLPTDVWHQPLFLQPCVIESPARDNLKVGGVISCEVKKTYPLVHPFLVRVVSFENSKSNEDFENKETDPFSSEQNVEKENKCNSSGATYTGDGEFDKSSVTMGTDSKLADDENNIHEERNDLVVKEVDQVRNDSEYYGLNIDEENNRGTEKLLKDENNSVVKEEVEENYEDPNECVETEPDSKSGECSVLDEKIEQGLDAANDEIRGESFPTEVADFCSSQLPQKAGAEDGHSPVSNSGDFEQNIDETKEFIPSASDLNIETLKEISGDNEVAGLNENVSLKDNIKIVDLGDSSEDTSKENNRGIEDTYQLSGTVQVKVSDVAISDGSVIFAVQPLYLQEEFSLLRQSMQDFYSSQGSIFDGDSNFCVAFHENEWCRGKILQSTGDGWTLMLVDYGKYVPSVDSSNVKNIDSEHINVPPFAVWCTLSSVFCPVEKTETARAFLCDKLKNTDAVIKILEGGEPHKINIFVDSSSVLNLLLKNSLVTQKLPGMYLEPGSYRAKLSSLNVNSSTVEIFVILSSFTDDYSSLHEVMQTSYRLEDSVSNVVESGIYAAYYNGSWYRGSVKSSGNDIQVFLVDTGETISECNNLCFLLPEHCLQPALAIPCFIPDEISESINNVLKTAEFLVDIDLCPETNTISATLIDQQVVKNLELAYAETVSLENQVSDPDAETENLENEVLDTYTETGNLEIKISDSNAETRTVENEVLTSDTEAESLINKVPDPDVGTENLGNKISDSGADTGLEYKDSYSNAEAKNLESEVSYPNAETRNLEIKISDSNAETRTVENEVLSSDTETESLGNKVSDLDVRMENLGGKISDSDADTGLEYKDSYSNVEAGRRESEVSDPNTETEYLGNEISNPNAETKSLKKETSDSNDESESVGNKLSNPDTRTENLENSSASNADTVSLENKGWENESVGTKVSDPIVETESLKNEISESLENNLSDSHDKIESLGNKVSDPKAETEKLENNVSKSNTETESLVNEVSHSYAATECFGNELPGSNAKSESQENDDSYPNAETESLEKRVSDSNIETENQISNSNAETESLENKVPDSRDRELQSATAAVQKQEACERLVGYLEESFTTESP